MSEGNPREDTLLIRSAERKDRILLTRDREWPGGPEPGPCS